MSKKSKGVEFPLTQEVYDKIQKAMQEEPENTKLPPDIQNKIVDECIKGENQIQINCVPPIELTRNKFGLLTNINYIFDPITGLIDYRKLIKPEFLVPNKQRTQETDITKLEDNQLLILLGGIRELSLLRGFTKIISTVRYAGLESACVETQIEWLPNYETNYLTVTTSGIATANLNNTDNFARNYLAEIAENRSFARCVRAALRIGICSKEEVSLKGEAVQEQEPTQDDLPYQLLDKLMKEKGLNFDRIKKKCIIENVTGAENFNTIKDIPKATVSNLIGKLNKYKPE